MKLLDFLYELCEVVPSFDSSASIQIRQYQNMCSFGFMCKEKHFGLAGLVERIDEFPTMHTTGIGNIQTVKSVLATPGLVRSKLALHMKDNATFTITDGAKHNYSLKLLGADFSEATIETRGTGMLAKPFIASARPTDDGVTLLTYWAKEVARHQHHAYIIPFITKRGLSLRYQVGYANYDFRFSVSVPRTTSLRRR